MCIHVTHFVLEEFGREGLESAAKGSRRVRPGKLAANLAGCVAFPKGPRTQIIGYLGPKTLLFGSLDP